MQVPNTPLNVNCNETHIQQLFGNILLNAIEVLRAETAQENPEIDISVSEVAGKSPSCHFR